MDPTYTLRQLCDVCAGDHVCYLCTSDEEKWQVLGEFYQKGHERKEKMVYLYERSNPEEIVKKLEEGWIKEIRVCVEKGQFRMVHFSEVYIQDGEFEPSKMIALLNAQTELALSEGYPEYS